MGWKCVEEADKSLADVLHSDSIGDASKNVNRLVKAEKGMIAHEEESKEVTDKEFIKELIKDVGVNAKVKFVSQIGN